MTTVATRVREISGIEDFDIIVTKNGQRVDPTQNGLLGAYPFRKKLKHSKRVSEWRQERFEATYPGYSCDVLNEDGSTAIGQTLLNTVRETYEE